MKGIVRCSTGAHVTCSDGLKMHLRSHVYFAYLTLTISGPQSRTSINNLFFFFLLLQDYFGFLYYKVQNVSCGTSTPPPPVALCTKVSRSFFFLFCSNCTTTTNDESLRLIGRFPPSPLCQKRCVRTRPPPPAALFLTSALKRTRQPLADCELNKWSGAGSGRARRGDARQESSSF